MSTPSFTPLDEVLRKRLESGRPYLEFLRVPAMSCGVYVLAAGAVDGQKPHAEDEIYYVIQGRAKMAIRVKDGETPGDGKMIDREVGPGDVIFVAARQEHTFQSIEEELQLLVIFAPAETL